MQTSISQATGMASSGEKLGGIVETLRGGALRYYAMIGTSIATFGLSMAGIGWCVVTMVRQSGTLKIFEGNKNSWVALIGLLLLLAVVASCAITWIVSRSKRRKCSIHVCREGLIFERPSGVKELPWTEIASIHQYSPSLNDTLNSMFTGNTWTFVEKNDHRFPIYGFDVPHEGEFSKLLQYAATKYGFAWDAAQAY